MRAKEFLNENFSKGELLLIQRANATAYGEPFGNRVEDEYGVSMHIDGKSELAAAMKLKQKGLIKDVVDKSGPVPHKGYRYDDYFGGRTIKMGGGEQFSGRIVFFDKSSPIGESTI